MYKNSSGTLVKCTWSLKSLLFSHLKKLYKLKLYVSPLPFFCPSSISPVK